jgi:hypothetical protein
MSRAHTYIITETPTVFFKGLGIFSQIFHSRDILLIQIFSWVSGLLQQNTAGPMKLSNV